MSGLICGELALPENYVLRHTCRADKEIVNDDTTEPDRQF